MFRYRLGFFGMALPFCSPDDLGGGGGGNAGGDLGGSAGNDPGGAPAEPSVLDVDDNALIRIKGSDKPVKLGEHVRGFQSQWTKAAQEAARLKKEVEQERALRTRYEQERQQAQSRGQSNGNEDVFAQLRQLPYLTGEDAVGVVQSIAQQIQQRDKVMHAALKQMKQLQSVVQNLNQTHTTGAFEAKIDRWLSENQWSPELKDLAKEVYLAYEGDDLDQEFPQIFRARVDQMRKAFEGERQAKLNAARKMPFVPGRGGDGKPSKPLEIKANANSRDTADELWNLFSKTET
jgi:hypothetical protein